MGWKYAEKVYQFIKTNISTPEEFIKHKEQAYIDALAKIKSPLFAYAKKTFLISLESEKQLALKILNKKD